MATESLVPQAATAKHFPPAHPMCPLAPSEIKQAADIVKSQWPADVELIFKTVTLLEPPKKLFMPYLEAEHSGKPLPRLERKAFATYIIKMTVCTLPRHLVQRHPAEACRMNHMKLS